MKTRKKDIKQNNDWLSAPNLVPYCLLLLSLGILSLSVSRPYIAIQSCQESNGKILYEVEFELKKLGTNPKILPIKSTPISFTKNSFNF
jgi:hypothetical protein